MLIVDDYGHPKGWVESLPGSHLNAVVTTRPLDSSQTIAGQASLHEVMENLRHRRPVFHSEADLQHSFARVLWELAPEVESRLEVPQRRSGKSEYLDLLCIGPKARTCVEFKYFTRRWKGVTGVPAETYALQAHAATDLARLHFVRDIARLERFCSQTEQNGLALMLTNEPALWTPPGPGHRPTRDHEFRIHTGVELAGTRLWANGTYEPNTCILNATYRLTWDAYSEQGGSAGEFRYLAVFVDPPVSGAVFG